MFVRILTDRKSVTDPAAKPKLRILHLEDNPVESQLVRDQLALDAHSKKILDRFL